MIVNVYMQDLESCCYPAMSFTPIIPQRNHIMPASSSHSSTASNDARQERWRNVQASVTSAVGGVFQEVNAHHPEALSSAVIQAYSKATVTAMSKAISSVSNTQSIMDVMTAADDLQVFHDNLQILEACVSDMENTAFGSATLTDNGMVSRSQSLKTAVDDLNAFAKEASDMCLDAYSHREGPKIVRKRETRKDTDWESFIRLKTILKGPERRWSLDDELHQPRRPGADIDSVPIARRSALLMVMNGRSEGDLTFTALNIMSYPTNVPR